MLGHWTCPAPPVPTQCHCGRDRDSDREASREQSTPLPTAFGAFLTLISWASEILWPCTSLQAEEDGGSSTTTQAASPEGSGSAALNAPQQHPQCVFLSWLMKCFVCLHHLYNREQPTLHNAHSKVLPIQLKPELSFCFPENEGSSWF